MSLSLRQDFDGRFRESMGVERGIRFYRYPGCLQWYMHHQNINIPFQSGWFSAIGTWNQILEMMCKMGICTCLNNVSKVMQAHLKFLPLDEGFPNKWSGIQPCWNRLPWQCQRADWQPKATSLIFWKSLTQSSQICFTCRIFGGWKLSSTNCVETTVL